MTRIAAYLCALVSVAAAGSVARAQMGDAATRRFVLMGPEAIVREWEEPLRIELVGESVAIAFEPAPTGETRLAQNASAERSALEHRAEAAVYIANGSVRVVIPAASVVRATPWRGGDPRTLAMIVVSLLHESAETGRARAPVHGSVVSQLPSGSQLVSGLGTLGATVPADPTPAVSHAQGAPVLGARATGDPAQEAAPASSRIHPYFGAGVGAYGHYTTQLAVPAGAIQILGGIGFTEYFRIELRAEGGMRPRYDQSDPGDVTAELVPLFRASTALIVSVPVSDKWALHLGSYSSLGLTNERVNRGGPTPVNELNESVGFGNFLATSVRAEPNLEVWLRLDLEMVQSLGWGTRFLGGLSALFVIR